MVRIAKPLEMYNFSCTQKLDWFPDVRIIHQSQDIVVGDTCFLLCCKVFYQVTDNIAGRLKGGCGKRNTGCSLRIDAGCVIDKVSFHSAFLDFFHAQSFGQLVQDCADQLDMCQLFCTNIGQPCFDLSPWGSVTLA